RAQRLRKLDREERLGLVEQEAAVAVGGGDQRRARFVREREGALHQRLGPVEELRERGGVEPVQDQHLRAGQQSRVQLEARILRGRADQHYRAVLDIGQEAVLLRAI